MPESLASWKTEDGKLHTDYLTALKHELMLWLSKMGDNEVGARKIVEALDLTSTQKILGQLTEIGAQLEKPSQFTVVRDA